MYKFLVNYFKRLGENIKTKQKIKKYKLNLELKQSQCTHLYVYAGNEEITSDSYPVTYEEWYYIRIKGDKTQWLNLNLKDDKYFMSDKDEYEMYKTKFTKEECDELIGTSTILRKVLVE